MIQSQLHPSHQGLVQGGMANPSDALRRAINMQLTSLGAFREPLSQVFLLVIGYLLILHMNFNYGQKIC